MRRFPYGPAVFSISRRSNHTHRFLPPSVSPSFHPRYGTDALRYSLVTGVTPGQDVPLSMEKVEANRNFANKLWNAGRFLIG